MIDRIENKVIDKMDNINSVSLGFAFNCTNSEAGEILQRYFNNRKEINGNLDVSGLSNLDDLGSIKTISNSFSANHSSLQSLGDLRTVKGPIQIIQTPIEDSGKLNYCEGLYISSPTFDEFKRLDVVHGRLEIINTRLKDLGSIIGVDGTIKLLSNNNLESIGQLELVGGDFITMDNPKLNDLGGLKIVKGNLDIREGNVNDFGRLHTVNGFVIAKRTKMNNFEVNKDKAINLTPLTSLFHYLPNSYLMNIPVLNELVDFNLLIIDDEKKEDNLFGL